MQSLSYYAYSVFWPKNDKTHLACENIRFSSLFAAGAFRAERPSAAKSEEKRMFSQAKTHPANRLKSGRSDVGRIDLR